MDVAHGHPQAPNASQIGVPGSRARLSTPALILDLTTFERNLRTMADLASSKNCSLRPHAKAHKCGKIGQRQVEAGAIGISCATLQEAEAMAAAGIAGILITTPVTSAAMIARVIALNGSVADFVIVVDHPDNLSALAAAARAAGKPLSVLVDCDIGQNRTGAVGTEAVLELARAAEAADSLRFRGLQAYYGHLQHIAVYRDRADATAEPRRFVRELVAKLSETGLPPEIVSGGGTGTHHIDMNDGVFTEIQAGSYPFMDSQYDSIQLWPDDPYPFANALFVQGTVVSLNQTDLAVVDCGWKAFATESNPPKPVHVGKEYRFMGDEHGGVGLDDIWRPELGQAMTFKPPHCDPTVNLYSAFHCVRDDVLVDIWSIAARGY